MKKNTSVLKELIISAKERLKNHDYKNSTYIEECKRKDRIKSNQVLRFLANAEFKCPDITIKLLDGAEEDRLNKKVIHLLETDPNNTAPLGELIDTEKFHALSEAGKQNYILSLSEKFVKIKEEYYKKQNRI